MTQPELNIILTIKVNETLIPKEYGCSVIDCR